MGTLQIMPPGPFYAGQAKTTSVKVDGVPKGSEVEVTLAQTQGQQPFWGPQTQKGTADTMGVAVVAFNATLVGPSSLACLKAMARDATGTYYEPNAHSFEVLP